jgi:AraC-like DNA-binding protein
MVDRNAQRFHFMSRLREPLKRSRRHQHPYWEICLYTQGRGIAIVGDHRVAFAPGTIICYPPAVPHEEESPGGCLEYYTRVDRFLGGGTPVPVLQDASEKPVQRLFELLYAECHVREPGWEAASQMLFDVALGYLHRWLTHERRSEVEELKRSLLAHIDDPEFSITSAMDALPLSRDHLRRRFIAATGVTPRDYLIDLRLSRAQRLLAGGGFSIAEIAHMTGFADQRYFSRLFRARTGATASAYRRHHQLGPVRSS